MKTITILLLLISTTFGVLAQDKSNFFTKYPFVNQTEFSALIGRERSYSNNYNNWGFVPTGINQDEYTTNNVASLAFQSFNGVYINKKMAVGVTAGIDLFRNNLLVPIALGFRYSLFEKHPDGAKFQVGLDAGFGTALLDNSSSNQNVKGGMMANPAIGFKFPTKNGSAWLLNLGYRYQYYELQNTNTDEYLLASVEERNIKRFQLRVGFEF